MVDDIPEKIQEKLEIIEKEAVFFGRIKPPSIIWYVSILYALGFVGGLIVAIHEKNIYLAGFFLLLGTLHVVTYAQNKEIYKLYSYAQDIINYYRDKTEKLKHNHAINPTGR